jgi:predicted regulator of Ras-like GTPase activity (Roadblock/LC7/MglB family)
VRFDGVIDELAATKGVMACAVVNYESGMLMDGVSPSGMDLDVLSAGNTEIVRSEVKAIARLYGEDSNEDVIDDILISLHKQYYLLRPMKNLKGVFMFMVLDRTVANLGLARRALKVADRHYRD